MKRSLLYSILVAIVIVGILMTGYSCLDGIGLLPVFSVAERITRLVMYILIGCYLMNDYAVPHGNKLKWVYFVFALSLLISPICKVFSESGADWTVATEVIAAVLIAFLAGELNHIKRNIVLSSIAFILICISPVYLTVKQLDLEGLTGFSRMVAQAIHFNRCVQFLVLAITYVFRYKEHRAAGRLADAGKA